MAFINSEVGFERSPVKLVLDREPRYMSRLNDSGPARVTARGITGHPVTVEYLQDVDQAVRAYALEQVTEAKALTLRELADDTGPLTVKVTAGSSETLTATISEIEFSPIIGHFPDGAPAGIRYYRVTLTIAVHEVIP